MREVKCKACGAPIRFIKMRNGRPMPVNPVALEIVPIQKGGHTYITADGYSTQGVPKKENMFYDGVDPIIAFESHFATCTDAKKFRKRG